MRIDGKLIAQQILDSLKINIQKAGLYPTLAVIQVGEDPASSSYIKQKQKAANYIGAQLTIKQFNNLTIKHLNNQKIVDLIKNNNRNNRVHGIIVQLPLPPYLDLALIQSAIDPKKDIDGFNPNSSFTPPVAAAVLKVLEEIEHLGRWPEGTPPRWTELKFLVIGRGITAGKPIAETLVKKGYQVEVAHSKTRNLAQRSKNYDVIISCVGRPNIINAKNIKKGAIVISVGIHRELTHLRGENRAANSPRTVAGKHEVRTMTPPRWILSGDFNEEEISQVASFYTPTPGGIGPINVACLMENLVKSSSY